MSAYTYTPLCYHIINTSITCFTCAKSLIRDSSMGFLLCGYTQIDKHLPTSFLPSVTICIKLWAFSRQDYWRDDTKDMLWREVKCQYQHTDDEQSVKRGRKKEQTGCYVLLYPSKLIKPRVGRERKPFLFNMEIDSFHWWYEFLMSLGHGGD